MDFRIAPRLSHAMTSVLSFIANPDRPVLDAGLVDTVRRAIATAGPDPGDDEWLAAGIALDLPIPQGDPHLPMGAPPAPLGGAPGDANPGRATRRRNRPRASPIVSTTRTT